MRLICPNCGAQYEVPTEVIPTEGRDVQCSACSNTWFQAHPDHDNSAAEEPQRVNVAPPVVESEANDALPDMPEVATRELDPAISDVLREEAEFEAAARAAEASAPLESQPDLGLEPSSDEENERRVREARERMAAMRGEPVPDEVAVAAATAAAGSRRDLLPDIEEINSTLRSSGERRRPAEAADADLAGTNPRERRRGGSFRLGFYLVLLLAIIALCVYIYGPQISAALPAAEPYVAQFTQAVESARTWLSETVDKGLAWLDQMAAENI
ncbi:zinc-ribbon domain-containing protein [Planktotalea sp.]|uniref:zinc-ribbon domain-containing protein n=1 Tax=Planktotalea sp. TaxID=2029877 RepID=UPI0032980F3A